MKGDHHAEEEGPQRKEVLMKKRGRPPKKKPVESFINEPEETLPEIEVSEIIKDGPFCDCGNVIDLVGGTQCNACVRRA